MKILLHILIVTKIFINNQYKSNYRYYNYLWVSFAKYEATECGLIRESFKSQERRKLLVHFSGSKSLAMSLCTPFEAIWENRTLKYTQNYANQWSKKFETIKLKMEYGQTLPDTSAESVLLNNIIPWTFSIINKTRLNSFKKKPLHVCLYMHIFVSMYLSLVSQSYPKALKHANHNPWKYLWMMPTGS